MEDVEEENNTMNLANSDAEAKNNNDNETETKANTQSGNTKESVTRGGGGEPSGDDTTNSDERADPNDADEHNNEDGEDIEDIEVLGGLDDRKMPANEGQSEDDENEVEEVPPPPPVQPQVMLYDRKLKTIMSGVILQNMRDQMVPKVEVETVRSGKKKSKSRDLKTMGLGHAVK